MLRLSTAGALSGLTRVRRFQQDDAHIFCTPDQVADEVVGVLEFIEYVYDIFGMTFNLMLSTRPEKYLGDIGVCTSCDQWFSCSVRDAWNLMTLLWLT